ncbi:acetoin utilization AcuB family protein [Viridibacillus sp. YIM B01967]|uniref:Acetoin utilization AcuB family protein n=1 Tax=Viridibacillus soli TaxID=2798301 RepID=A0ABS1H9G1_9BACL|nr:acetoin utilization AcuB family protein [Viridibacillus soli]MBK3496045.1 acetoin utilization AcuB family protein [Viridibacillus soli]
MIVEEIMNTTVFSLQPSDTIKDAVQLLKKERIRHLPITNSAGEVIGLVTERDIKNALPSSLLKIHDEDIFYQPLENIMTKNIIVGHPLDFVEEIALIFYEQRIGCLPIVSAGKLVGIVTGTDLLYNYIELTGANKPSSLIEIRVPDVVGILFEVTKVFHKHRVSVLSVLVYPDKELDNMKILSIRVKIMNPLSIIEDLRKEGFDVLWPNMPGMNL